MLLFSSVLCLVFVVVAFVLVLSCFMLLFYVCFLVDCFILLLCSLIVEMMSCFSYLLLFCSCWY